MTINKKYIISLKAVNGEKMGMKELRVEDDEKGGIILSILCCEGKKIRTNQGRIIESGEAIIIPPRPDIEHTFSCIGCGDFCTISYDEGCFFISRPRLSIAYKRGEEICVSGCCNCTHSLLRDEYTETVKSCHCVDSRKEGKYPFRCPCGRTHVLIIRNGENPHFHIVHKDETGEEAILSGAKQGA